MSRKFILDAVTDRPYDHRKSNPQRRDDFMAGDDLYQVVVNSVSANIAILDERGVIIETNDAWREYGRSNGMPDSYDSVGINYLSVCQVASAEEDIDAGRVAEGIRRVMQGEIEEFFMQYPCHSPEEKRWYALRVVPYRDARVHRVIVTHDNITPIMAAQEELERKEAELRRQAERLEETNIALKVVLRQREEDRRHIEATVLANVERPGPSLRGTPAAGQSPGKAADPGGDHRHHYQGDYRPVPAIAVQSGAQADPAGDRGGRHGAQPVLEERPVRSTGLKLGDDLHCGHDRTRPGDPRLHHPP